MTPEERQMLTDLANKVAQTPSPAHDAEAEEFIRTHIGNRPDALYLMTQTVLIQNMALDHAKQEIQQLQQRVAQTPQPAPQPGGGSFLGRGGGWATPSNPPQPPPPPQQAYVPPQPAYVPPQPAYPQPQPAPQGGGMGSFLRGAGTTVAGIAAGALAFEGIRSLFGGASHMFGYGNQPPMGSGFLGGGPGFLGGGGPGETVINNYYEGPEGGHGNTPVDDLGPDDSAQYDDTSVTDDSADDSANFDDSSNFDDGSPGGDDSSSSGDDLV